MTEKNDAEDTVKALIGDICVSMRAEDYLTMPPLIVDDIPVTLSPQAKAAYARMERDYLLELADATIEAGSAVALTGKLLQLCGGNVYDTQTGTPYTVHGDKLEALAELLEGLHGQHALLFYGFRHEVRCAFDRKRRRLFVVSELAQTGLLAEALLCSTTRGAIERKKPLSVPLLDTKLL